MIVLGVKAYLARLILGGAASEQREIVYIRNLVGIGRKIHLLPCGIFDLYKLDAVLIHIVRLLEHEFSRIAVALGIIELHVYASAVDACHIRVQLVDNARHVALGGSLGGIGHIRGAHNTQRGNGVLSDGVGLLVKLPAHDIVAGAGHGKVARSIHIKGAVAGEQVLRAVVYHKEIVALYHDVKGISRGLRGALAGNIDIDSARLYAQTDLSCVDTAGAGGCIGSACPLGGLAHQIGEDDAAGLVSYRIYVCDIVTNNVHLGLVRFKAGNTRKK